MTVSEVVALWGIGTLVGIGTVYGDIRSRLGRMEKLLGNGTPGVFVRKEAMDVMVLKADESHERIHARIDEVVQRVDALMEG